MISRNLLVSANSNDDSEGSDLTAPLQFLLLGSPQILLHGHSLIPVLSRRAQALLYYLAFTPNLQQRSRLASLFWPDMPEAQARKNLRNILPELRKYLGDFLYISFDLIGFKQAAHFDVDVSFLIAAIEDVEMKSNLAKLVERTALYQGDFLEGFFVSNAPFYEEWVTARREQYRHTVVDGLYQAAQRLLESRDISLGIKVTRRLLEIERWHEAAHRLLMQFWVMDGQRTKALRHYESLRSLLLNDLGMAPDESTELLYNEILSMTHPSSSVYSWLHGQHISSLNAMHSKYN